MVLRKSARNQQASDPICSRQNKRPRQKRQGVDAKTLGSHHASDRVGASVAAMLPHTYHPYVATRGNSGQVVLFYFQPTLRSLIFCWRTTQQSLCRLIRSTPSGQIYDLVMDLMLRVGSAECADRLSNAECAIRFGFFECECECESDQAKPGPKLSTD